MLANLKQAQSPAGNGAGVGVLFGLALVQLKTKADLLPEEGGTAPTLWHFIETKEKLLKLQLGTLLRPDGDRAPQICRMRGCEFLHVSGFILIPMGWNKA